MANVTIYTRARCSYCDAALALLAQKQVTLTHIDAGSDPQARADMIARAGGASTYPQIFIGAQHVGGCDDLSKLDATDALDALLND